MVRPFLKWAGGKRWLIETGRLPTPVKYHRYVEPFLGGGAVFFHSCPQRALLSDLNSELISLYQVIKKRPDELYFEMVCHQKKHSKNYYYEIRSMKPRSKIDTASRFLYLNRACWNGLYRVNMKGQFNVPIGTKDNIIFETDDFNAISDSLRCAKIISADFEEIIDKCDHGDFLFVDPPYTAQHNYNNFRRYNEKIFSWSDQLRLRDSLYRAKKRGVKIVMTNADHASIRSLYEDLVGYFPLVRHIVLSGDPGKRGKITEALFFTDFAKG